MNRNLTWILVLFSFLLVLLVVNSSLSDTDLDLSIDLALTSDLHADPMGYNYLTDREFPKGGMSRVAATLKDLRSRSDAFFLLDLGGAYSGNFLIDYVVNKQKDLGVSLPKHPVLKSLEYLDYNGFALSYHELGYGMAKIEELQALQGVDFFNANVYNKTTNQRAFEPYLVLEKVLRGRRKIPPLKIGIVGLLSSEGQYSAGSDFVIRDPVAEIESLSLQLAQENLSILVLSLHLGILDEFDEQKIKSQILPLTQIEGVNLIVLGFDVPSGHMGFNEIIDGVHIIAPPSWGLGVGISSFKVGYDDGQWILFNEDSQIIETTERDPTFDKLLDKDHQIVTEISKKEIANIAVAMTNNFAMIEDSQVESLVNEAQIDYIKTHMSLNKERLPVISLSPPFAYDAETRNGYTELSAGGVKVSDLMKFYQMPGTLIGLEVTGKDVRDYLEWVSQAYIKTNADEEGPQYFMNKQFPLQQFAMIDGLTYRIDIRQPSRYRGSQIVVPNARRITNLMRSGQPVRDTDKFLLVANGLWLKNHPFLMTMLRGSSLFETNIDISSIILHYFDKYDTMNENVGNWKIVAQPDTILHFLGNLNASSEVANTRYIQFIRSSGANSGIYQYDPSLQK